MGADAYNVPMPFTMGVIVAPLDPGTEGDIIVQWLVPLLGRESAAGAVQGKQLIHSVRGSLFRAWRWLMQGTINARCQDLQGRSVDRPHRA